jgi:hypothetical protein
VCALLEENRDDDTDAVTCPSFENSDFDALAVLLSSLSTPLPLPHALGRKGDEDEFENEEDNDLRSFAASTPCSANIFLLFTNTSIA